MRLFFYATAGICVFFLFLGLFPLNPEFQWISAARLWFIVSAISAVAAGRFFELLKDIRDAVVEEE